MPYIDSIEENLSEKDLIFKWLTEERISFTDLSDQYIKHLDQKKQDRRVYKFFEI